jgi:plastocyanin
MTGRWLAGIAAAAAISGLSAAADAATVEVKITGLKFVPAEVAVHPGDTITWVNGDFVAHTATATDRKSFDVAIKAGGTGSLVVEAAGTFDYFCRFHPMMTGRIVVVPGH